MSIPPVCSTEPMPAAPEPLGPPCVTDRPATARGRVAEAASAASAEGAHGMSLTGPHDSSLCEGRGCSRHHPSTHHMRDWPTVWREYYGYSDRVCAHGVGHPDPDDVAHLQSVGGASTAHPCDGCCIAPLRSTS